MDLQFSTSLLAQCQVALANPIPLDKVRGILALGDLWRCEEFIF